MLPKALSTVYEGAGSTATLLIRTTNAGNDAVRTLKLAIANSHGVLICTRIRFLVCRAVKNALDWTVHTGDLNETGSAISFSPLQPMVPNDLWPSLLLTMQALGTKHQQLDDIIVVMCKKLDASTKISDPETETQIKELLTDFVLYIQKHKPKTIPAYNAMFDGMVYKLCNVVRICFWHKYWTGETLRFVPLETRLPYLFSGASFAELLHYFHFTIAQGASSLIVFSSLSRCVALRIAFDTSSEKNSRTHPPV